MKVLSIVGYSKTGKTTTVEHIIKELRRRNYSVGTVKDIHFDKFAMDEEGRDTWRHHEAGADPVTARSIRETDILYSRKLDMMEVLKYYDNDFVILEGVRDFYVPKILSCHEPGEIDGKIDESVFMITGCISNTIKEYQGIPVINSNTDIARMVDVIEERVFKVLPNLKEECCGACGYSCREMVGRILSGAGTRQDCIVDEDETLSLMIDGERIKMVPFVKKILQNVIEGIISELHGYRKNAGIKITIGKK